MCGRFSFVTDKEKAKKALPKVKIEGDLRTSFNIAPTQQAYVVNNSVDNYRQPMFWGLVPHPPDNLLAMYRVSEKVNSVKYDAPDLHQQVPDELRLF